ncbi:MAG TPA: RNA polymerase sigma factor [Pirellulales bacterium]|nr:RNA polymerase sigma factor [Pirellulales bacterium]
MSLSLSEFNRLVSEHGPAVYRLAYRLVGDWHEAEDIVQETFRSVWKSRGRYQPGRGDRAWLAAILRRRVADCRRRRSWWPARPLLADDEPAIDGDRLPNDGYTDEMQQALRRLPNELRETLLLVVVGELTHQEAADVLKVPLGTVLSRVSRARQQLRQHLISIGRESPTLGGRG